jgi:hypothetical protein
LAYAKKTTVPVDRSRAEIEKILSRYGADKFFYGTSPQGSGIGFEYKGRAVRMSVPNPNPKIYDTDKKFESEKRRMWRVLCLALKAKLELIDAELTTFEDEFLAQTALPSGQTVSQWLQPQFKELMETGEMPKLLISGEQ